MLRERQLFLFVSSFALILLLAVSGVEAYDRTTWALEIFPVVIALPILWATYRGFPLTGLVYSLIFIHACVLIAGGAYSYARVPLGFQLAEWFNLSRNPYDKVGHFFQGFVPVLVAREILIRGQYVTGKKMLRFIVICIILAISASFELVEWAAAIALGQGADEFLGTQGDMWDTQSDMLLALIGAISSLALFSRIHDRQIIRIQSHGN
jgi:putative membrane protein